MATFDQLAADQRAIIEIVLKQRKSYAEIGEMLDLPSARVRELARDALAELAPFTAEFVDPQWRGQLADYVLRQQTGPEAQATRGHLRRSEPARIWTYSLLDALDDFYGDDERPEIPQGEAGGALRSRGRAAAAPAPPPPANGEPPPAAAEAAVGGLRGARGLSPAALTALRRRRIIAAVAGLVVIGLLVFGGVEIFGGGSGHKKAAAATRTGARTGNKNQAQIVAAARLAPIGGFKGSGAAAVYKVSNRYLLVIRAKFPPASGGKKYVVWLYNSDKQAAAIAADVTDKKGNFSGGSEIANGWQNFRFVDITYQSGSAKKHGNSVMRGPLLGAQQGGNGGTGTSTGTGTTTTP
jgi:hypothetical protein